MQWRGSGFVVLGWWWLVAAIAAAGVLTMSFGDLRWGGRIMAGALLLGAVIRLIARPARRAGGLNVRHRALDVLILLALSAGVLVASATVRTDDETPNRGRTAPSRSAAALAVAGEVVAQTERATPIVRA